MDVDVDEEVDVDAQPNEDEQGETNAIPIRDINVNEGGKQLKLRLGDAGWSWWTLRGGLGELLGPGVVVHNVARALPLAWTAH